MIRAGTHTTPSPTTQVLALLPLEFRLSPNGPSSVCKFCNTKTQKNANVAVKYAEFKCIIDIIDACCLT
jgi:hypothetical protein